MAVTPIFAIKTADEDRLMSAGYTADADLTVPLQAGAVYEVNTLIIGNCGYTWAAELKYDLLFTGTFSHMASETAGRLVAAPGDEQVSYQGIMWQLGGSGGLINNLGGGFNAAYRGGVRWRTIIDVTTAGDFYFKWQGYSNTGDNAGPSRLYAGSFILARPLCS